MVKAIKKKRLFGYFPFKDSPLQFNIILSALKATFEQFFIKYGISNRVIQNAAELAYMYSVKNPAIDIPEIIPRPKTRFQKLSLLSLSLIQFIQLTIYNSYMYIVSSISKKLKLNRIPLVVITAALFTNVTYAGELESLIAQAEKTHSIPKDLLLSIALVESRINPHVLNVEGKAVISKSLSEVKGKLKQYLKSGYTSIDIGVMQVNYRWHREQFITLDEMLEPKTNIDYAARFLKQLYKTHGSWIKAVRHYHSANPEHHRKYSRKIIVTWLNP